MDIAVVAVNFKPLQDLFQVVLMQGTTKNPLFKLADVAKYIDDEDNYTCSTKNFDSTLMVKSTYHDGKQHRSVNFLTERGLHRYVILSKTKKGDEFLYMIVDILTQMREQVIIILNNRIDRFRQAIHDFPYPDNIDDRVKYKIVAWITRNIGDRNAIYFPYENVTERTRNCIKECILQGNNNDIHTLMCEAYQEFYNLLILGIDQTDTPVHDRLDFA